MDGKTTQFRLHRQRINIAIITAMMFMVVTSGCAREAAKLPGPKLPGGKRVLSKDERMKWWREARFGMFIHWGVYSVPAGIYKDKQIPGIGEWIMNQAKIPVAEYKEYAKRFNPVKYDPNEWVGLAKEAGMKYIVITSKHHDGFALFDSKATNWDIVDATPYGKDLLKPLAESCKKHGIKLGFYYSQAQDWCHPGGAAAGGHWDKAQDGDMDEYIRNIAVPQVKEILTNYGEIAVLWWDTPVNMSKERADMLLPLISLQPGIVTNNRLGGGYNGDFSTPEQYIPATGLDYKWETCMTMNNTWGYKSYDNNWKSTETLLRNLVDIASKGGNYLLNVGPTSEGLIPEPSVIRLKEIGKWMKVNGESIYGTTASPFEKLTWGRCTQKRLPGNNTRLYLHVFDWPVDRKLTLPGLDNEAIKAFLLADESRTSLKVTRDEDAQVIHLPAEAPDPIVSVVVLDVKGKAAVIKPPEISVATDIFVDSADVKLSSDLNDITIRYTPDGSTPTSQSPAYTKPIRIVETTTVTAQVFRNGKALSGTRQKIIEKVRPRPAQKIDGLISGLIYEYYQGEWKKLPDFDAMLPVVSGKTNQFDLSNRKRNENFGLRFSGYITVPATGVYTFYTESDDGSKLYIGDKLVVDNDGLHASSEASGLVALEEGIHPIKVTFFQGPGDIALKVLYSGPKTEKKIIPASSLFHAPASTGHSLPEESKQQQDNRMDWWREARFGMFIHWGIYSVPAGTYKGEKIKHAGEWIMNWAQIPVAEYEQFAKQFNPLKFNADEWVQIAKNAGMKYIVITSKHHDGFCLWDSKVSNYDIMDATPFKRDILKELSEACKKEGIRLCFYHSIMDWHHPDAQAPFYPNYDDRKNAQSNPNFSRYVENYMKPQLKELVTNYGPLGVLWFDGEWVKDWTEQQGKDMYNYVLNLQPDIIINNRVGKGRKGTQGFGESAESIGDFGTPEQRIPPKGLPGVDWETCMTMNNTWGYRSDDNNWKSKEVLIRHLADIASKGGNFLLNVGPTSEGLIPQPSIERLAAMGEWMKVNGESIYGTTASPLGMVPWGRCTAKPGKLYLHIFDWPTNGKLDVAGLKNKVKKAYLLADKKQAKLAVSQKGKNIVINLPEKALDPIDTVVVLEIKGKPEVAPQEPQK